MPKMICQHCGNTYSVWECKSAKSKYCSVDCKNKAGIKKIECHCKFCGVVFYTIESKIKRGDGIYCSHKCAGASITTKTIVSCKFCGKQYQASPSKLSKGEQMCCSLPCRNKLLSGSNSTQWRGGITPLNRILRNRTDMQNWRRDIFARDNYLCVNCGNKGRLNAHHIIPFSCDASLRLDISNGITLCEKCHKAEHKRLKKAKKDNYDLFTA